MKSDSFRGSRWCLAEWRTFFFVYAFMEKDWRRIYSYVCWEYYLTAAKPSFIFRHCVSDLRVSAAVCRRRYFHRKKHCSGY